MAPGVKHFHGGLDMTKQREYILLTLVSVLLALFIGGTMIWLGLRVRQVRMERDQARQELAVYQMTWRQIRELGIKHGSLTLFTKYREGTGYDLPYLITHAGLVYQFDSKGEKLIEMGMVKNGVLP